MQVLFVIYCIVAVYGVCSLIQLLRIQHETIKKDFNTVIDRFSITVSRYAISTIYNIEPSYTVGVDNLTCDSNTILISSYAVCVDQMAIPIV